MAQTHCRSTIALLAVLVCLAGYSRAATAARYRLPRKMLQESGSGGGNSAVAALLPILPSAPEGASMDDHSSAAEIIPKGVETLPDSFDFSGILPPTSAADLPAAIAIKPPAPAVTSALDPLASQASVGLSDPAEAPGEAPLPPEVADAVSMGPGSRSKAGISTRVGSGSLPTVEKDDPTAPENGRNHLDRGTTMKITSEASAISGGLKELGGYAAAFGEARKIGNLKDLAKQIGPFLGAIGPFIAFTIGLMETTDATTELIKSQFQIIGQQLSDIQSHVKDLPNRVDASNALQTYIQDRNDLYLVWSQYELFLKAPDDDSLKQDFKLACQRVSPHSWLDTQVRSLTADGRCGLPMQCILEPEGGLPKAIAYSRPSFLQFLKTFVQDAMRAVELASSCAGIEGALEDTIRNVIVPAAQESYQTILNNLLAYYDGPMRTAFWKTQFYEDIDSALEAGGDNAAMAKAVFDAFAAKYDFMKWGVVVWNAALGSEKQGTMTGICDSKAPPETCTDTGGSFKEFRHSRTSGPGLSFMVFFLPASERPESGAVTARLSDAVNRCSTRGGNELNMEELAECVDKGAGGTRGVLAVPFGSALRFYGSPDIAFQNTHVHCGPESGCDVDYDYGLDATVVALPTAPAAEPR